MRQGLLLKITAGNYLAIDDPSLCMAPYTVDNFLVPLVLTMTTTLFANQQAAAIPIHAGRICLVTSRSGKNWVVPKGCLEPGKTAGQIALQEAWEEAGLVGSLHREPVGSYLYQKWGATYHVTVFLMEVTEVAAAWPEAKQRQRQWFHPTKAQMRVDNPGLREILQATTASLPASARGGRPIKEAWGAAALVSPAIRIGQ
jgi:8-oxo-dGTP pyrophosphatase MutT (NUDIX family)